MDWRPKTAYSISRATNNSFGIPVQFVNENVRLVYKGTDMFVPSAKCRNFKE